MVVDVTSDITDKPVFFLPQYKKDARAEFDDWTPLPPAGQGGNTNDLHIVLLQGTEMVLLCT